MHKRIQNLKKIEKKFEKNEKIFKNPFKGKMQNL